ncbi:stage III sporulation protein AD [Sediminibacillus massiliensis]|uniref:stage III sporulation protein AD n=1 Tax=Sediminibacillus massiliensis TaxID=1926277 RepID=UPI0009883902|nr:stage III sporulation protein AD [Sediminibacillus massiliensis]
MEIFQVVSLGLVASLLFIVLKDQKASLAFLLILVTGIIIFLTIVPKIAEVFALIENIGQKANVNGIYIETILKIIGIAYIADFGAHLTRDAGLNSVAAKIELAGKVFILVLAVPILTAVIETILGFLPV